MARRNRRWIAWVSALLGAAILATAFGYLVHDHVAEDQRYDAFHATLVTTRQHAHTRATELAELRRAVSTLQSEVATNAAALSGDAAQLKAAAAALWITQADISQQGSQIGDLHTCLGGVQQALNALAIGDQVHAVSALNAVSASCSAASGG